VPQFARGETRNERGVPQFAGDMAKFAVCVPQRAMIAPQSGRAVSQFSGDKAPIGSAVSQSGESSVAIGGHDAAHRTGLLPLRTVSGGDCLLEEPLGVVGLAHAAFATLAP
jgi:hypothetical protein